MQKDILIYARITEYLSLLTENDSFGRSNSKGIENYDDLAEELNAYPMISYGRSWSPHSLQCFFSRIRKKYASEDLRHLVSSIDTGFDINRHEFSLRHNEWEDTRNPEENRTRIALLQALESSCDQALTRWKGHEKSGLVTEQKYLFKQGFQWLKENKIDSKSQIRNKIRALKISQYLPEENLFPVREKERNANKYQCPP